MRRKFICDVSNGKIVKKKMFQKDITRYPYLTIKAKSKDDARRMLNDFLKEKMLNYISTAEIFSFDSSKDIFKCGITGDFTYKYPSSEFFKNLQEIRKNFLWLKDEISCKNYFIDKSSLSNGAIIITVFQRNLAIADKDIVFSLPLNLFNFEMILAFDKHYAFRILKKLDADIEILIKEFNKTSESFLGVLSDEDKLEYELMKGDL